MPACRGRSHDDPASQHDQLHQQNGEGGYNAAEVRLVCAFQRVDHLFIVTGTKCCDDKTCVSPRVNNAEPWVLGRDASFTDNVADFVQCTTVNAAAILNDIATQNG